MADTTTKTIIIKGDLHTIFEAWKRFDKFPEFMGAVKSVEKMNNKMSHWVVEGPLGNTIEWNAYTTRVDPDQRIAWTGDESGDIKTSGQVTFAELPNQETQLTLTMKVHSLMGTAIPEIGKFFGTMENQLENGLRDFKEYIESETRRDR